MIETYSMPMILTLRLVKCLDFGSGHCQELAPKYREAASTLATADLPRPVVLAKYDDSTDSQRRLRGGAEDGNCASEIIRLFHTPRLLMLNPSSLQLQCLSGPHYL